MNRGVWVDEWTDGWMAPDKYVAFMQGKGVQQDLESRWV